MSSKQNSSLLKAFKWLVLMPIINEIESFIIYFQPNSSDPILNRLHRFRSIKTYQIYELTLLVMSHTRSIFLNDLLNHSKYKNIPRFFLIFLQFKIFTPFGTLISILESNIDSYFDKMSHNSIFTLYRVVFIP